MSEDMAKYGVSYTASAPEEFKVGDRVEMINYGRIGKVIALRSEDSVCVRCEEDENYSTIYQRNELRRLPDAIHFDEQKGYRPIPLIDATSELVNRFKKITDEMVETYKAKNATYGNAYADGFSRFGAVQLVSRIYEKYCHIENLLVRKADNKVSDESVRDTLTDMANQCIILRMLLESQDVK